jgi:hypothetical protein
VALVSARADVVSAEIKQKEAELNAILVSQKEATLNM